MTDTQPALLRAILSDPASDDARLVYADWLQDDGDQPDRAELFRVQIELANKQASAVAVLNDEADWTLCDTESGLSATWCPNCGDCTCQNREESMSDPGCPLHAPDSAHCCKSRLDRKISALRSRERELLDPIDDHKPGQWGKPSWEWFAQYFAGWGEPYTVTRGFISQVTCTSADWLQHHAAVFWHPDQAELFPRCQGENCVEWAATRCRNYCAGTGRIPRPCPATAQPIERVVLTTEPDMDEFGPWSYWSNADGCERYEFREWPGIVFEVRPGVTTTPAATGSV